MTSTRPWLGISKHDGWTISAPWQSKIAGPFEAQVYLDPKSAVRVSGKTGEECHANAVQYIKGRQRLELADIDALARRGLK